MGLRELGVLIGLIVVMVIVAILTALCEFMSSQSNLEGLWAETHERNLSIICFVANMFKNDTAVEQSQNIITIQRYDNTQTHNQSC